MLCFFFSSRRRHTRCSRDWSSDVCSSDLEFRLDARWLRLHNLSSGFRVREKAFEAAQTFLDALKRSRVRKPQIARRAKRLTRNERHVCSVEKHPGNLRV